MMEKFGTMPDPAQTWTTWSVLVSMSAGRV